MYKKKFRVISQSKSFSDDLLYGRVSRHGGKMRGKNGFAPLRTISAPIITIMKKRSEIMLFVVSMLKRL